MITLHFISAVADKLSLLQIQIVLLEIPISCLKTKKAGSTDFPLS